MCHAGHAPVPDGAGVPAPGPARPPALLPRPLFPDPSERAALAALLEGIRERTLAAIRLGDRPGALLIRRELDPAGRRVWAVRDDRDHWLPYVTAPRAFMAPWPSGRALALLAAVRAAVAAARAIAAEPAAREEGRFGPRLVR